MFRLRYLVLVASLLPVAMLAGIACGGDDDDGSGAATATTTTTVTGAPTVTLPPFDPTKTELPSIAPVESDFCSEALRSQAIDAVYSDIQLTAEGQALTVADEDGLAKDSKAAVDVYCAEPDPGAAQLVYCQALLTAIRNNVTGDETAKQKMVDGYALRSGC